MKNFFWRLISALKEVWNMGNNYGKQNMKPSHGLEKFCDDIYLPKKYVLSNLPEFYFDNCWDYDSNTIVKVKKRLYYKTELECIKLEISKKFISSNQISILSGLDLTESSDRVDINYWLHDANVVIKTKKKIIVVGINFYKAN